ncbi:MAG: class I SAM-dependent methyltransferase [Candidatus Sericytochromatia bacterium]|nr:class I SAM-dependent methyltransferase [Candidatus Sericytochromatia bacterium]
MSRRTIALNEDVWSYLTEVVSREPASLRALREETGQMAEAGMQISPEQGQLLALLTRLTGTRKALEVGVFTGYSSLAVALALPADGRLVALDVSEPYTAVARRHWEAAGVAERIALRLGPAVETLAALRAEGHEGTFDFAFIDADKPNYERYYDHALALLRPGGLLAVDNTLWGGRVADPTCTDPDTAVIRALNARMCADPAIDYALLPVGDGLSLAWKRP